MSRFINSLGQEQKAIREKLKLRVNDDSGQWEVYTTKHGSDSRNGIFRWYLVDLPTARWYMKNFPLAPIEHILPGEEEKEFALALLCK